MTPLEMSIVLTKCKYKDWKIHMGHDPNMGGAAYFEWHVPVMCVKTGKPVTLVTNRPRRYPWEGIQEHELIDMAYDAIGSVESHERAETFTYDGVAIFEPHERTRRLIDATKPRERLIASRCEHGEIWDVDCPKCYGLYEAEEGTRQ